MYAGHMKDLCTERWDTPITKTHIYKYFHYNGTKSISELVAHAIRDVNINWVESRGVYIVWWHGTLLLTDIRRM